MEQILGLVLAVLLSVGASWIDKWWKAYKRNQSRHTKPRYNRSTPPATPPAQTGAYAPVIPPAFLSPENEGGSITQLTPRQVETPSIPVVPPMTDATAPEPKEFSEHYRRWRQAIIDAEVLAPRSF